MTCEEIRELAADVALGISDGEQRAEVLRHIATCSCVLREGPTPQLLCSSRRTTFR